MLRNAPIVLYIPVADVARARGELSALVIFQRAQPAEFGVLLGCCVVLGQLTGTRSSSTEAAPWP